MREVDQAELAPELAVIARAGLFQLLEVRVELLLVRPGRPVDALEHLVPLVAAPVRAGDVGQLERAEAAGRGDVGAAAEIEPLALAVDGERLVGGDVADDLDLVFLADAVEDLDGLVARPFLAADRQIARHDLRHLLLDAAEVVVAERPIGGEVIVEATCVPGKSSCTAIAIRWAVEWRIVSSPASDFGVTISTFAPSGTLA